MDNRITFLKLLPFLILIIVSCIGPSPRGQSGELYPLMNGSILLILAVFGFIPFFINYRLVKSRGREREMYLWMFLTLIFSWIITVVLAVMRPMERKAERGKCQTIAIQRSDNTGRKIVYIVAAVFALVVCSGLGYFLLRTPQVTQSIDRKKDGPSDNMPGAVSPPNSNITPQVSPTSEPIAQIPPEVISKLDKMSSADKQARLDAGVLLAAKIGDSDVARAWLAQGADINAKSESEGCTPLMYAAANGNADVVHLLLKKGADVNAKDNTGRTVLMCAVLDGHTDIVRTLLEQGSHVNDQEWKYGYTALMIAAYKGQVGIVRALLEKGADVYVKDNAGRTAEEVAQSLDHVDAAVLLSFVRLNGNLPQ